MSKEQLLNQTPTEVSESINSTDIGIGLGAAIGLFTVIIPMLEKLDKQYAGDVKIILGRIATGVLVSLSGAGIILLSNRLRNR